MLGAAGAATGAAAGMCGGRVSQGRESAGAFWWTNWPQYEQNT